MYRSLASHKPPPYTARRTDIMTVLAAQPITYDFVSPSPIVFGWGRRVEIGRLASRIARRAFVVCGSRTLEQSGLPQQFDVLLRQAGVEPIPVPRPTRHEPEVADVDELTRWLIERGATDGDCLIAVGGGSTIDLAKAAAKLPRSKRLIQSHNP